MTNWRSSRTTVAGRGRKHLIATLLTIYLLAALSNMRGPLAAAEYAQALSEQELKSLGAWWNKATGRYEPPTKPGGDGRGRSGVGSDAAALYQARLPAPGEQEQRQALAADGKRIRGANRNGTLRYETATLVEHTTGLPLASLNFHDQNGELAPVGALLEMVPISGAFVAHPSMRCTPPAIPPPACRAAWRRLSADRQAELPRNLSGTGNHAVGTGGRTLLGRPAEKGHGRLDRRYIDVLTPPNKTINYPHVSQVFRVLPRAHRHQERRQGHHLRLWHHLGVLRRRLRTALLAWNRGHWAIEWKNHQRRDKILDEDACLARSGLAPANRATCQQPRADADPAPSPVGQRGHGSALLYPAPQGSLADSPVARLRLACSGATLRTIPALVSVPNDSTSASLSLPGSATPPYTRHPWVRLCTSHAPPAAIRPDRPSRPSLPLTGVPSASTALLVPMFDRGPPSTSMG